MRRIGAIDFGCLFTGALVLLVLVMGWKLLDFLILRPASVKGEINDVYDEVRLIDNPATRWQNFKQGWRVMVRETDNEIIRANPHNIHVTSNQDSIYFDYSDSLCFPMLGSWNREFVVKRLFSRQ
ncbi:MAG: hypothetical protein ACQETZ_02600 [Candidatus Fermentibacterota bacterium]